MLLKQLRQPILTLTRVSTRQSQAVKCLATQTKFDPATDYDIDLVELKKKPRINDNRERSQKKLNALELPKYDTAFINSDLIARCIREAQEDPLDYRKYADNDNRGYLEFISRYNEELKSFLEFVKSSYGNKIESFDQLTSVELLNTLYIFKDLYLKKKVENVNKYNYQSYNYMFDRLSKYLKNDASFPVFLQNNLYNDFENNRIILDLYIYGISKFINELTSLSKEFDFSKLSIKEISNNIEDTILKYEAHLSSGSTSVDETFFKCYLQAQRYRNLKHILDSLPVKSHHILYIINNENSKLILKKINESTEEVEKFNDAARTLSAELSYIKFLSGHWFDSYAQFITFVYQNMMSSKNDLVRGISDTVLSKLTPFFTDGTLKNSDFAALKVEEIVPLATHQDLMKIYEFSVLAHTKLPYHRDTLILLKNYANVKYSSLNTDQAMAYVSQLRESLIPKSRLSSLLESLNRELSQLRKYISWNLHILDDAVEHESWFKFIINRSGSKSNGRLELGDKLAESTPYVQIPDNSALYRYTHQLATFQEKELGGLKFKYFPSSLILNLLRASIAQGRESETSYINQANVGGYVKLDRNLEEVFGLNGGTTSILDTVIHNHSVFADFDKRIEQKKKSQYVQIPDDLPLHLVSGELRSLRDKLGGSYANVTPSEITAYLGDSLYKYYQEGDRSFINDANVAKFSKLDEYLKRLFAINGYTSILDTFLHGDDTFVSFEKAKYSNTSAYKQIPDDLELHKFIKELQIFRDDEIKRPYSEISSDELLRSLDKCIDVIHNSEVYTPSKRMNKQNIHNFMRLSKRLTRLFEGNNGYTAILDTLIHSQSVFDNFEKKKSSQSLINKPYRQVPENFMLEDYLPEILDLKARLGNSKFEKHTTSVILQKLKEMANDNETFSLESRINFYKLYRNIAYLFKFNGGQSFILDNIILNNEVFSRFESKKLGRSDKNKNIFARTIELCDNNYGSIQMFSSYVTKTLGKDISRLSAEDFEHCAKEYEAQTSSAESESTHSFIERIISDNKLLPLYPQFLLRVKEEKAQGRKLTNDAVGSMYNSLTRPSKIHLDSTVGSKTRLTIPMQDQQNKFNMSEFMDDESKPYVDPANFASTSSTYNKQSSANVSANTSSNKQNNEPSKLGNESTTSKANGPSKKLHGNVDISEGSLEDFLKKAKRESDSLKERRFRERKAYEWSESMCKSNRSLEGKNFFNPIGNKGPKNGYLLSAKPEYLVLTVNGERLICEENPLGSNYKVEDMFTILNRFSEEDLNKFIKHINKLQKHNWKLIGGGNNQEKMLVLKRDAKKSPRYLSKLKTLLASAGAVFLTLVSLNLWFNQDRYQKYRESRKQSNSVEVQAAESSQPEEKVVDTNLKKHDVDYQVPNEEENSPSTNSSRIKSLFWRTK
ncbi:Piso0_004113 [Millerozyma farinosa CBS 7064]|uniref:Piso0_004113 protein n=1 Tax=Pichia sorbitophila (strain ATCC MYA-4447 / BCRC 22081 / CBS 7064 / NBRC 10061 / NRRL Y-12695) TaxID=559304 RepID=G8Y7I6_PICSO|nr:Piso0_004113 [Millerozyma farinosa CBS 7064]CCE84566.1 Piso0_004113 [Millerozyma farinosa CBS 7064]